MNLAPESLGIIAGNRSLPLEFSRQARAAGVKKLVAIAFENETDPALAKFVDEIIWLKVGQLSKNDFCIHRQKNFSMRHGRANRAKKSLRFAA